MDIRTVSFRNRVSLQWGYPTRLLAALTTGWAFVAIAILVISPLLPAIIEQLELTSVQAGISLSVLWFCNAFSQYPGGQLSDSLSRKTVVVLGFSVTLAGVLSVVLSMTYSGFLLGAALIGSGSGLYSITAYTLLSEIFPNRPAWSFGVHSAGWDLGGATSGAIAIGVLLVATWRLSFVPVIFILAVLILALHRWMRGTYVLSGVSIEIRSVTRTLFGGRRLRLMLLVSSLYAFGWQGTMSFLPAFLHAEKGMSVASAGIGFAALFVVGFFAKPLGGSLGDRYGHINTSVFAMVIGAAGLALVIFGQTTPVIGVGILVFAAGLTAVGPILLAYVTTGLSRKNRGGTLGGFRTMYIGFGSFGPLFIGYVANIHSYALAFIGVTFFLLVSASILVWIGPCEKPH